MTKPHCPKCDTQCQARHHRDRSRRVYYYCPECKRSWLPTAVRQRKAYATAWCSILSRSVLWLRRTRGGKMMVQATNPVEPLAKQLKSQSRRDRRDRIVAWFIAYFAILGLISTAAGTWRLVVWIIGD